MKRDASLRHVERGVVSISIDGTEICITLARALHLDDTHQVVGRVQAGMEVIEKVSALPTTADDGPAHAVTITRCGVTDAAGEAEFDVVEDDAGKKGGASAAEALERDVAETRQAVSEALQAGLKRKAGEGGQSKEAVKKLVKQTAMDAVLLGGSSDGSDSDSESD